MKLCLRCNQYFEDNVEQCPTDNSSLENVGKDPLIGDLINNRYLVDSVIGKGSSGIVYRATRLGRGEMVVAIKVLHSFVGAAGPALDRFLRESQAASKLRNPHIITIWESGVTADGQPFFVMDYLEGLTLGHLIRDKGQIEPARVLSIIRQTCEALTEAHRQGIVHRDLKPENIILQETDHGPDYVKLLDFGIADSPQYAQSSFKFEKARTVSGSPAYMSPEQCQGFELDARSDIYSLGIVVFEMLTGKRPFRQTDNVNVMVLHVNESPQTLSAVRPDLTFPAAVENVLARALSKQPADRQATIQDFLLEIEQSWPNFAASETELKSTLSPSPFAKLQQAAQLNPSKYRNVFDTGVAMEAQLAVSIPASALGVPNGKEAAVSAKTALATEPAGEGIRTEEQTSNKQVITGRTPTVERLIQAVQKGESTRNNMLLTKDQSPSPKDTAKDLTDCRQANEITVNTKIDQTASRQQPIIAANNAAEKTAEDVYIKQKYKTTLSRVEGWQKVDRPPAALITTRARAAALKAATVSKPVNILHMILLSVAGLCLCTCFYIIYSALSMKTPPAISVDNLLQTQHYLEAKVILEDRQLLVPLSPEEKSQLNRCYLNMAKFYLAANDPEQALPLLNKIDPNSASGAEAKTLMDELVTLVKPSQPLNNEQQN